MKPGKMKMVLFKVSLIVVEKVTFKYESQVNRKQKKETDDDNSKE